MKPTTLAALSLLAVGGCLTPTAVPTGDDGVPIGVLLPYTGDLATVGQNLERAVIMANERLAQSEPDLSLPPFRLIFRDTHSDDVKGYEAAEDLIEKEKAAFILGPEEPRVADAMAMQLRGKTVAITGGAVSLDSVAGGGGDWFRIVPTAKRMSSVLAERMIADSVSKLAIIYTPDDYGTTFARLAAEEFTARNGVVVARASLTAEVARGEVVRSVLAATPKPEAILLVTYPTVGAAVVQEWAIVGNSERWYFAPSLRSEVFALNIPPGLLEDSVGISAGLAADARNFAKEFKARWGGEPPSPNAHYYFDAMLLAGMSYRYAAFQTDGRRPTAAQLAAALVAVSGPGGRNETWQDVGPALLLLEKGTDIDYRGITGPVDFSPDGSVPQGFVQKWTIKDSTIQPL
jgi:ABC-type branched-subunit amino acid transport system substrate-binding protein